MTREPTTSTFAATAEQRSTRLRVAAVLLLASGFVIYSIYGHLFYAGFLTECRHIWGADLNDADDGTPNLGWLYAFLIGALPLALASRPGLHIMIMLMLVYNALALPSLVDPYTGSDCGIHSGNDQDFTGNYVLFMLGYGLLLMAVYIVAIADLGVRGIRLLSRRR